MKKLIFSFFLGLFLLTSSQQAFVNRRIRPEISFDIESVISINNSIGNSFIANKQEKFRNYSQQPAEKISKLDAKLPFLVNYSNAKGIRHHNVEKNLENFRKESNGWNIHFREIIA